MVADVESEPCLRAIGSALNSIAQHPLPVQSFTISPPHSLHVSTDVELYDMLSDALDAFDDAPVGAGARGAETTLATQSVLPSSVSSVFFVANPPNRFTTDYADSADISLISGHP